MDKKAIQCLPQSTKMSVYLKISCVLMLFLVSYNWWGYIVWALWISGGARHGKFQHSGAVRCPLHSFCTMPCVCIVWRQNRVMPCMSQHHFSSDGLIKTEREIRLDGSGIYWRKWENKIKRYRNWQWNAKWMEGVREKMKNRTEASVIVQTVSCLSDLSLVLFPSALLPALILSHVSPFSSALYQRGSSLWSAWLTRVRWVVIDQHQPWYYQHH